MKQKKVLKIKSWSGIKKITVIALITWVVLAIIFGFYDLAISIAFVDEASIWGIFGADYGETPGYALIALALGTLLGSLFKNLKLQKIPAYVGIVIGILFIVLIGDETYTKTGWSLIIALTIYVISTWNKDLKNYRKIAGIIALLAVINPLLFVQITKVLCGRIRFRDLAPGYTNFTPWFLPPGISAGGNSFPSGHTAMGWMFLPLLIAVKDRKNIDPLRILTIILVVSWGIFVGLSRIAVGAHYASDVLFSTAAATFGTIFLYVMFYKKRDKEK